MDSRRSPKPACNWRRGGDAELLVVGGPTHMHGLSTDASRRTERKPRPRTGSRLSRAPPTTLGYESGFVTYHRFARETRPPSTPGSTVPAG